MQVRPSAINQVSLTHVPQDRVDETSPIVRLRIGSAIHYRVDRDVCLVPAILAARPTDNIEQEHIVKILSLHCQEHRFESEVGGTRKKNNIPILIQADKAVWMDDGMGRFRILVLNNKYWLRLRYVTMILMISLRQALQ